MNQNTYNMPNNGKFRSFTIIAVMALTVILSSIKAYSGPTKPSDWIKNSNKDVIFELHPDSKSKSFLKDTKENRKIDVTAGDIVNDDSFGPCFHFGENEGVIEVTSTDRDTYPGGVTFETWIYLEKPMQKPAKKNEIDVGLINKRDAFAFNFYAGKLNQNGFRFFSEKIPTDNSEQYDYYPMLAHGGKALTVVPSGKWVHLAMTYDEKYKMFRYWIDGKLDSERQFNMLETYPIPIGRGNYSVLSGMRNCRVAGIRLLKGVYNPGPVPPMMLFCNQLPWQDKVVVSLDRIDSQLNFPLEAKVFLKSENDTKQVAACEITSPEVVHMEFSMNEGQRNKLNTCMVKVFSKNGKEVFSDSDDLSLPKPSGDWIIHSDKSISFKGKRIFPRIMYAVLPEDFEEVQSFGINMVVGRFKESPWHCKLLKDHPESQEIIDAAKKTGLFMTPFAREDSKPPHAGMQSVEMLKNTPLVAGWYSFDEPFELLNMLPRSYNAVKMADPSHPILICQNNLDRAKETSLGCDVLMPDPYPIPKVCLRLVSDCVQSASRGTFGLKPVWVVLDAYPKKLPNKEEMRCMIYLALCAGANGVAIFDWDERTLKEKTDPKSPKYLKNHPESFKAVKDSISELASLENIVVNPNLDNVVDFEPKKSCLHSAVKVNSGKKYLFIASDSRQAEQGTIVIKGLNSATAKPLPACGYSESIQFSGGNAQVKLPKLAAAVFEIVEK